MELGSLTTTAAAEALERAEVALLPVGSTEQHGPALPLSTDALAAESVAAACDRDDVVRLPTLPVGVSAHHRQFHGTLWLDEATFASAVEEVLASAASHGLRKAVVVNGHGGNVAALDAAARRLRADRTAFVAPWSWWRGVPDDLPDALFDQGGGHADAVETSVLLHLAPALVDRDALEAAEAGASEDWGLEVGGAQVGFDTLDFSDSGATGRPTQGDADAGRQLLEAAGEALDELVDWLVERPLESLWPKPHR